ncbi:hypothetical protein ABZ671_01190 [Micromonospora sp. NPDC006766]|uniref:hypothetical protein n=1 Tax=Micromonospora sp. NPDC006766 TaxID=3154778 RepID=UPI0033C220B2
MSTTTKTHRAVCADYTREFSSEAAARTWAANIETSGHCRELHTIEVRDGSEWAPLHVAQARRILAADLGTTTDGLVKMHGGWSAETSQRANAAGPAGSDAWRAALGAHEQATLTADGRAAETTRWCACPSVADDEWVRYERWSARGREAHGYVHSGCRALVQAG